MAAAWRRSGVCFLPCPNISRKLENLRQKGHRERVAAREGHLSSGIMADFGDNAINRIVAFWAQYWSANAGLSIGSEHVVAESKVGNSGCRLDAVGLHASHDL
jgi:hypothetical protein